MKIAIIGYGRMGHIIEETARRRGHEIVCVIDAGEKEKFASREFASADVAIEFSIPTAAAQNVVAAFAAGVPVVSGTTGWNDDLAAVRALCDEGKGSLLHSSNFSIGIALFRAISRYAASLVDAFPEYLPELTEIHHIHKLDHPSGTAVTLAADVVAAAPSLRGWREPGTGLKAESAGEKIEKGVLPVWHERLGEVPGTHTLCWTSDVDSISLTHTAFSRQGFAEGAVVAAEWLAKRPRAFYQMEDMLPFLNDNPKAPQK